MILVLLACRTHFEPPDPKDTSNWRDSEVIDSKETDVPDDSEDSPDSKESEDSKEDTGPFDVDGDGYPLSQDCNDHDPQAYPGAPEVWYDGKDADCDNHDDFDQDYDGHARSPEGDDCSDLDPSIHPGADDTWYDGVDSDCAGNDDYDQDVDGYSTLDGDCDDLNATVYETAEERLGDGVDQDCFSGDDGMRFTAVNSYAGTDLQGPRLAENADGIGLFFVAGTAQPAAQVQATVLFRHQLDAAALSAGPVSLLQQAWGGNYSWNQGIDYHSDDSYEVFGYGITTAGGMRLAVAHSWEVGGGGSTYSHSTNTIQNFEDVELIDGGDGNLELVACDEGGGTLVWMRGSPATWYGGTTTREEELLNAKSGACSTIPSTAKVYTAENGSLQSYSSSGSNLTASGSQSGWTANDIESSENGHSLWVVADGAAGIYVALDGQTDRLAATDATRVDASVDSQGRLYVVAVDNGVPVLWWGSPGAMVQATLDPQLASVEDVAVLATSNNDALIAIRGGVTIVYGWAKLP